MGSGDSRGAIVTRRLYFTVFKSQDEKNCGGSSILWKTRSGKTTSLSPIGRS